MGSKRVKFNNVVQKAEYERLTSEESMVDYDDMNVDSLSDDDDNMGQFGNGNHKDDDDESMQSWSLSDSEEVGSSQEDMEKGNFFKSIKRETTRAIKQRKFSI
eukprot:CAMPEP_0176341764 /NCGR_PEP_ID=MMETSP0126-20121128/2640_1 /TAXON_ID=141414 ORGANISM="Strombidinopsis acuminatum, Strain SPMC142" /NCGR_SAMPLE_ID=MMETSP0126 /ASSEMBLY_ACC=CAM_ASM_000229 /LENGTH=102 /DNA_ID=CAMNT_0017686779 /DNA_START=576 /DNA_END=884 /DNA_ORIENTATION=-